ncbi:MAG: hypothetical protein KF784_14340 [Fimbriimonadaceae bacterium]|nr:hypothetical protein [Fimbriimonadaceae bacterium]
MRENDRFTDKEASAILRRAMEIESSKGEISHPDGLTRDDLARVASEVGIEPKNVEEAIRQYQELDMITTQERWLGAPEEYEIERMLDVELSEESWQAMVGEMNAQFSEQNGGNISGNTYSWRHKHGLGYVHVLAQKQGGKTLLRLKSHIDDGVAVGLIITCFTALLTAIGVFSIAALPIAGKVMLALASVGVWLQILRGFAGNAYRRDKAKMRKLFNRLEEAAYTHTESNLRENLAQPTADQTPVEEIDESSLA